MKEKKISFIVPVYNVEQYLERCINSILNQTYTNIELILVNDGSPDNSEKIIEKYNKMDSRVIAIKKKNEGVSVARNTGLKKATGEYILFVDSDDYIESDYAEYLFNLIERDNADVAISLGYFDDCNVIPDYKEEYHVMSPNQATEQLYLGKTGVAVWNKIYKKRFLELHNIQFIPKFWFAEGMTFNVNCFQNANKIAVGRKKIYHQTYNPNSAVRKFNLDSWHCGMRALNFQKELWKEKNKDVEDAWNYHYRQYYFSILKGIYMSNSDNKYLFEIKKCVKELRKNISYPLKANISIKEKIKCILCSIAPIFMVKYTIKKEKKRSLL